MLSHRLLAQRLRMHPCLSVYFQILSSLLRVHAQLC